MGLVGGLAPRAGDARLDVHDGVVDAAPQRQQREQRGGRVAARAGHELGGRGSPRGEPRAARRPPRRAARAPRAAGTSARSAPGRAGSRPTGRRPSGRARAAPSPPARRPCAGRRRAPRRRAPATASASNSSSTSGHAVARVELVVAAAGLAARGRPPSAQRRVAVHEVRAQRAAEARGPDDGARSGTEPPPDALRARARSPRGARPPRRR